MAEQRPRLKHPKLKQTLYGFQIFFIVLSAVIGGGIFNNDGEALEVAGPAGLLLSVGVIGIVAICVSECISELVQQFPVYNAVVEYVRVFVDEDLGWVVGVAYWYMFASVFAVQNLAAASLSQYWGLDQTWQTLAFYVFAPLVILILNFLGVFYYGIVESIGGFLKICLVLGVSVFLYVIAAQKNLGGSDGRINDGFKNNSNFATKHSKAVCYAIPLVAYSFQGVEIITMTAFEARDAAAIRWPSRWISYAVVFFYLLCTIGETLNISWKDDHLPPIYGGVGNSTTAALPIDPPLSTSMVIVAAWKAGHHNIAGFLNGCFIFSVLSASNTSLYVSSRTLYGLTREMPDTNWVNRQIKRLSLVVKETGVPAAALLFTAVSFIWLPFLQLKGGYALNDLIEIFSVSASVACLIVWAALCLAFIRYQLWLEICDADLDRLYPEFRRDSEQYTPRTFLSWLQPLVAWVGLVGCILIFGFASATWWDTRHVVLFALFIFLKLMNKRLWKRWGVKLDSDVQKLVEELDRLNYKKLERNPSGATEWLRRLLMLGLRQNDGRNNSPDE
ncbi:hypothetical protein VTN00DRAFT_3821 [Thermoascus crustaceus]|uniref:uncharacterized protein n=1 Tax=Thermoascus crustaceus TaxID=5088 RepID=UPI00374428B1